MKTLTRYFICFLAAFTLFLPIAAVTSANRDKSPPQVIYVTDAETEEETIVADLLPIEYEPDEEEYEAEYDENAYRRVVYIPEHVIVVEINEEETEEEYLAPPEPEMQIFATYVYADTRKPLPASESLQRTVHKYAELYGLPYKVVLALLGIETTWNENPKHTETHGGAKYIGIGCINEEYHAENMAKRGIDIYTLDGNVEAICWLLKAQYDRFGTIELALMAYNAGGGYTQGQVERGVTENGYSRKVMEYADSFE